MAPLLRVQDLKVQFFVSGGTVNAVDGVSFEIDRGEIVGIVGESGSGKTMTALSLLRLIPEPGRITNGRILYGEKDVAQMTDEEIREFRGNEIAMIFQDPMTSLNPVLRIGFQVEEAMIAHQRFSNKQAKERVVPMLQRVRIPAAKDRVRDYPHQFSGGMRQRAMIAMGVSNEPSLLIADEPTTALDVTVQASIIELIRDLSRELRASVILITHNMALVASLCNRVIVMYAGRIVEQGPTRAIFKNPQHPYTWSLLRSMPRVDEKEKERLISIKGLPPDLGKMPPGCKFHPRCKFRVDRCFTEEPPLDEVDPGQRARCWVLMKNIANPEAQAQT
ncbi:MAG: ABC transporter ATP-binding protein [Chloroflexi bacterium]|nr:MAG: ABC transporter ATP-binding protein [Chloroflexota bacterium]TME41736.1 MAG: ABC transporter ATP-binding protein [Chloroflexota bacterium]TME49953.1 MAG: ABC transporter ATP-binding protein [Chloroflexota bacterium]